MNRPMLQLLVEERLKDAVALTTAGQWPAAYYLAGYAVECALKSCILRRVIDEGLIFTEPKFAERCWVHDLEILLKLAALEKALGLDIRADPVLGGHWDTIKEWKETSRYLLKSETKARQLLEAISHPTNGLLQWLRRYW